MDAMELARQIIEDLLDWDESARHPAQNRDPRIQSILDKATRLKGLLEGADDLDKRIRKIARQEIRKANSDPLKSLDRNAK